MFSVVRLKLSSDWNIEELPGLRTGSAPAEEKWTQVLSVGPRSLLSDSGPVNWLHNAFK